MKFYANPTSPSPKRVRMFLAEKGLSVEEILVDTMKGQHLEAEFLALNPWATIPVLELSDGTCISEAIACCRYLEETHPEPPLMGRNPQEKAVIAMWEHRMEWDGFVGVAEMLRNTADRMKGRGLTGTSSFEQIPALAERGKKRVNIFHNMLEARCSESGFIAGDMFTVADITAFVSLEFGAAAGLEPPDRLSNLARWRTEVKDRPSAGN